MSEAEEAASAPVAGSAADRRPDRDRWRVLRPLAHRDFRALFAAVVLSIFAAGMWAVVMVYAVIAVGGGPLDLSLVAAANATGLLVCAIPGGIVADRVSRRLIVRTVSLADFLAITSVVVVGAYGPVGIVQLVGVAFVLGAGAGFFFPAYSAILPRILPPGQLLAANGLEGAIRPALQQAAGPAAAGMLLAALIPAQAAVVIAVAHGAAFVILLFLGPEPVPPGEDSGAGGAAPVHTSVFADLREAVVFTVRTPWLLWTLLYATMWVLVAVGPEEVLLPFLTRERVGEDPRLFGFLLAVYGAGGVLGSIVVSSRKLPRRYLTTMNLVWGVSTLPFVVVGLTDQYWLLLLSLFIIGFGFSYGNVIWGTLLQRRVPRHMLGRVSSLDFFVSLALMPLSMAIAGPLAEVLSLQTIFIGAGILPLLFGIVAILAARMPHDELAHPLTD
ncbi:MFS transporter [Microbacterium sp. zg.B48]|uniref:MFS transporter n=1 Tax=unclassified Microbacterium TaxID=2609290 RepID=UPI00214A8E1C|nr:MULTISPECIES: MFS transporter [unclassified Microbacterium]MCR2764705.1 MFS transporter [Microbacterium sp. zg.B48]MCR2810158.1 MFS transporter [Microbacterium sp. zg.B185]WIM20007.1 MFS transporter [Microbacterium sp. zg-B185]